MSKSGKVTFKPYDPGQLFLLPPSLEELIKPNHPVRVVHQIIEGINIDPLEAEYKGGGTSSYHPKMMLKVIVFAYLNNIYSSRKIEAALEENIHFMWLSGMSKPDHNSINRFRSDRLQKPLKKIFVQIVELLAAEGLLDLRELYTDGTKIEANANRYTFVWGKAAERSSYSKTDPGATFMRMKEDHMKNGQLKPAYNVQISSNNRYIVNYSLHQSTTDTGTFISHLEQYRALYQQRPREVTADSGYGSEENYAYLEEKQIEPFVKYNYFHKELHAEKRQRQNVFASGNLPYDEQSDTFTCPAGKQLYNIGTHREKGKSGYMHVITRYQSTGCTGCALREQCHKSKYDRTITVNHRLREYKRHVKEKLTSERGLQRRRNRPADIEQVFAQIKHNKGFKRFMLRGKEKVAVETGLIAIAHNLAKKAAQRPQN